MQERRTLTYLDKNLLPSTAIPIFNYNSSGNIESCNITEGVTKIKCFWVPGYNRFYTYDNNTSSWLEGGQNMLFIMDGASNGGTDTHFYGDFYTAPEYEFRTANGQLTNNFHLLLAVAHGYNYRNLIFMFPVSVNTLIGSTYPSKYININEWEGKYVRLDADAITDGVSYLTAQYRLFDSNNPHPVKELYQVYFEPYEE